MMKSEHRNTQVQKKQGKIQDQIRQGGGTKKKSRCPVSGKCGGCSMIDTPYEEQLRRKQDFAEECLAEFGRVEPMIRMKNPDHYRNKVNAAFGYDRRGKAVCGVYRERTHEIVPVKECLLEGKAADRIVQTVYSLLPSFKIRPYDEDRGTGLLRHVQVRTARTTGQIMVTLVCASPVFPSRNNFVKELRRLHPEITTIVMNINERDTSVVLGNREVVLFGKGYIEDVLCGKRFRISSRSFYQINSIQTEKLYNIAIDCAGLSGKERVLDVYCGIGTIGIIASDKCREVLCTEINADAVRDAGINAAANDASNVRVYESDAGEFMEQLAEAGEQVDVLFMDPPRAGADEKFLESTCRLMPKKIVYISCNPVTLSENLDYLTSHGYSVRKMVPVDMFPYTEHIETVVQLSKGNISTQNVRVEFSLEDMDMSGFQQGATYEQIQEWIQEKYGFHVTHLNIAKTKQKCGIIERQNYNLPKSEGSRPPETPREKEEAIIDAFLHFKMM